MFATGRAVITGPITRVSRATADHYTWGAGCDGWHLVRTPTLSVIAERMPPGTAEAPHRHARAQQLFYVLEGTLTVVTAADRLTLQTGEAVRVPPGVIHQVRNEAQKPAQFLVVSEPPGQGDRADMEWPQL